MKLTRFIWFSFFLIPASLLRGQDADTTLTVREVVVQGNEVTKDFVILREMALRPGIELTQDAIEHDRDQIYNLGLFNRVDVDYTTRGSDAIVYVTVNERWYLFPYPIFGLRYRDINKLYYGLGFSHQNFRGRNEKVHLSFALGYDRWASLMYQNPKLTDGDDLYLNASLGVLEMHSLGSDDGGYLNTNASAVVTLGKRFGFYQTLFATAGYEVWQVSQAAAGRTASASGRDAFPAVGLRYRYDTRNVREYATDGGLLALAVTKSGFGESEVNLVSAGFDARRYSPLGGGTAVGVRCMTNVVWGGIVPRYRRSFFGYDERIRGYFNDKIESESQLLASTELRVPILLPRYFEADFIQIPQFRMLRYGIYAAVFADAGRGWNRNDHVAARPWYGGVGAGLHFLLPYGATIRTEFAVNDRGAAEVYVDFDTSF